ncbi:MAG: hypothetical protein ACFFCS_14715 [Candidatus Hodarchaeota archaeon]
MNELSITNTGKQPYVDEIESTFFKDDEAKSLALRAQGRLINNLVNVVVHFTCAEPPKAEIKDIRIGTLKGIRVKDERKKNISWMRIVIQKK